MRSFEKGFNPMTLEGKTLMITGASSGIGRATAVFLSRLGARCVLLARNEERLNETQSRMEGQNHSLYSIDLSDPEKISKLFETSLGPYSPFSGLVHCAGISKTLPLRNTRPNDLDEQMEIHLGSFFELVKAITKRQNCSSEGASIVAVSSITALSGVPGLSAYSASKGALISAIRALAVEFAPRRIRFNCICPGWIETPMVKRFINSSPDGEKNFSDLGKKHPLGLGKPDDVAGAAAFLIGECSKWITGSVLVVDGGYSTQ